MDTAERPVRCEDRPLVTPRASEYRPELDGLRAVSIVLVVGFHSGVTWLSGGYVGVDVFFVLSGFLITGLLLNEHRRSGRIDLREFYARRARRLLPMSALVLTVTLLAGLVLLPPLARVDLIGDVRSAVLYVANWRFAGQATAYSDTEVTDSLVVHFWSLSIEEQFYFVWPALIALVAWGARKLRRSRDLVVGLTLSLLIACSFVASVVLTDRLGPEAYYLTHTRLWEMGVGGALALVLPRLRQIGESAGRVLAVAGVGAIGWAAISFDGSTAFPGSAALVPVLGAAALIVAGTSGSRRGVIGVLSTGALTRVGRWSYAWYLWHWPVIGVGLLLQERWELSLGRGSVIAAAVVLSLALAAASHHLIENPVRHAKSLRASRGRNVVLAAALMAVPLVAGAWYLRDGPRGDSVVVHAARSSPSGDAVDAMTPAEAASDTITLGPFCHAAQEEVELDPRCVFGDPSGDTTILLTGDSHARHWLPALDAAGSERGWKVVAWTKSACQPIHLELWNQVFDRAYDECAGWRDRMIDQMSSEIDVDVVLVGRSQGYRRIITMDGQKMSDPEQADELWGESMLRTFGIFDELSDQVIVLRDTPWPTVDDVPDCLSEHASRPDRCSFELAGSAGRDQWMVDSELRSGAAQHVTYIDLTDLVCRDDPCSVVTDDGTITYRDSHHLTQRFSRSLAPEFGDRLSAAIVAVN
jgi:peptidoglycan/LPS O-acetylase OafA/YrhL